jgi:hypothetical protein
LAYAQRTTHAEDGRPLHGETGYWRLPALGRIELVVAHPTGVAEVAEGTMDGTTIELATTSVATTASAKDVRAITRRLEIDGDVLHYTLSMAAVGQPLTEHLRAELRRS